MIENPKHVNALNLLIELAERADSERRFYNHRYMPDDPRGRHPSKPGESVTKLSDEQRELLSHLRSEDVAKVCYPPVYIVPMSYPRRSYG